MNEQEKKDRADKAIVQRLALKKIENLTSDSEWNLLEQILQEIEAYYVVSRQKIPANEALHAQLTEEVKTRFADDEDVRTALLEAVPSRVTISKWRKKKGWEEAIWAKVRGTGLFTGDKRAAVINNLYSSALEGNVNAAKIWLTLSGDYTEKDTTAKNDAMDMFRQLNEAIHSKK